MKMTFQEIRIIATGPCIANQLRDVNKNVKNIFLSMFGSGYENCPEFGVLGGVIFKLDILQTGRKITVLKDMLLLLCAVFVYLLCALPVIIVKIRTFT
jgi:hypothetical protein